MKYNPALDGLRAMAALSVLAFHCQVFRGGFVGVDVFFVLSGYLITSILRKEIGITGKIDIINFYFRRGLRLWPPLVISLAAYFILAPRFLPYADPARDVLLAGLYLTDYSMAFWRTPVTLSHTWSLAVEEHFYFVWPFFILATARLEKRALLRLLVIFWLIASLWRTVDAVVWNDFYRSYYRFDTHMSGLIIGSAAAVLPQPLPRSRLLGLVALPALLFAVTIAKFQSLSTFTVIFPIAEISAAALILSLAASDEEAALYRILSSPPLVYLGLLSYSIYLWHYPVARYLRENYDPTTAAIATLTVSLIFSVLTYEGVERPIRSLRKQRFVSA